MTRMKLKKICKPDSNRFIEVPQNQQFSAATITEKQSNILEGLFFILVTRVTGGCRYELLYLLLLQIKSIFSGFIIVLDV